LVSCCKTKGAFVSTRHSENFGRPKGEGGRETRQKYASPKTRGGGMGGKDRGGPGGFGKRGERMGATWSWKREKAESNIKRLLLRKWLQRKKFNFVGKNRGEGKKQGTKVKRTRAEVWSTCFERGRQGPGKRSRERGLVAPSALTKGGEEADHQRKGPL